MDLSALIFVALAVAWAVYLIPKAIKHHDEVVRSRSVERFSASMRVLARREPVSSRNARLVVAPSRVPRRPQVETKPRTASAPAGTAAPVSPASVRPAAPVTRESARLAARRRRNVLAVILLANAVVATLAATAVIHWAWTAIPATLLVAWLVACRLSVRAERARRDARPGAARPVDLIEIGDAPDEELTGEMPVVPAQKPAPAPAKPAAPVNEDSPLVEAPAVVTGEIPIVTATEAGGWTMIPTVLPTYVDKPAAPRRTVSTIDLDSTGVWSSARNESDAALAREADEARRESAAEAGTERRASGA